MTRTDELGSRGRRVPARIAWPIVQRAEEDRAVAVVAEHHTSVALVGAPGLGKSTAAARVTDRVAGRDPDGRTLLVPITAVATGTSMPFGAISERFGDLPAEVLSDETGSERRLREAADAVDRDLLIRIDDADHLDAISARYVAWLVRNQHARLVLTCRDFTALAEPLRSLWQDDLLERIDLGPLDLQDTARLIEQALDAPLESASVERVHRATDGNPLYLREVVRAALTSGALEHTASGWYWRGRITASNSLADMYRTELGSLPGDLRDVVDIVALADPIPLSRLLGLVGGGDVDHVVALGLVRIDSLADGAPIVRPSHPLIGEVVRSLVPVARRTTLFARANAFRADHHEGATPAARLRAALWALECGVRPPVAQLLDAAQVASGLQELESAIALSSAALRVDLTPTERVVALCLRSLARGYSIGREAGRADAQAAWDLVRSRRGEVADAVVIDACETLANIRQFHDDDTMAAVAMTDAAVDYVASPDAVERLRLLGLAHLGWGGHFTEVRDEVERSGIVHAPTVPMGFLCLAPCAVTALATAGRLDDAMALGTACLATATVHVEDAPWSVGELLSVMHQVQVWRGDFDDMITSISVKRSNPFLKYDFTLELIGAGNLAIGQRRWDDAVSAFSAACERYAIADSGGFGAYPWARLAMALASAGRAEEATAAIERWRATPQRAMRITGEQMASSVAWAEVLLGNPLGLEHAEDIIARSTAAGSWTEVLSGQMIVHAAALVRGQDLAPTLDALGVAAGRVDGPLAHAVREYVAANQSGDRTRIVASYGALARCGLYVTDNLARPPLTRREYEVAELAAQGLSNRLIAERLGLSVRTIDAHLSRVFQKWELHARSELADLLHVA
ncbi:LuxR C-terminal-related transcriptional regulator [Curtobacterium sp. VKM Ac-2922]|uniref:LuxR C-terminal-related transcriptional regulator n=1 Tax=Curtobacterium sp. VKM Ac-2922 TaxID=2929475 RepID=UPI001FB1DDB4|nr:LuxR C-terminal-related transcriptional regulator [Curtobacterium sp. VKM Ac-2922]MCJ1714803.1 LuxR C-terminal-related transcriptional regulator [Curtobacterium sp. VKM Ac-2922]